MFSPSPQLQQTAQPGILARILGAIAPAQTQGYEQARLQGQGTPRAILSGLGKGLLSNLLAGRHG